MGFTTEARRSRPLWHAKGALRWPLLDPDAGPRIRERESSVFVAEILFSALEPNGGRMIMKPLVQKLQVFKITLSEISCAMSGNPRIVAYMHFVMDRLGEVLLGTIYSKELVDIRKQSARVGAELLKETDNLIYS